MNQEEVALLRQYTDEVTRLRERLHKLADMAQAHEGKVSEHTTLLKVFAGELETLKMTLATKESVEAGTMLLTLKIDQLNTTLDPIRRSVYWVASIIVGAVLVALLALVLRTGG